MPRIAYIPKRFSAKSLLVIERANEILAEYMAQGFDLTLRQLYYQFVARGLIPNVQREYKRLGSIISDARLAGLIDWKSIVDRTRFLRSQSHWDNPEEIIEVCAKQFLLDKWSEQPFWPEVWIEKDALVGVITDVCERLDIPFTSCRGYSSQSTMWDAAQRLLDKSRRRSQTPVILHFGDHDPSGIDMTRDIEDRLSVFGLRLEVRRLALNMDQVEQYGPPPNPAKVTDSRYDGYVLEFGEESWELDALEPAALVTLIEDTVEGLKDDDAWKESSEREQEHKDDLHLVADKWDDVVEYVKSGPEHE